MARRRSPAAGAKILATGIVVSSTILTTALLAATANPDSAAPSQQPVETRRTGLPAGPTDVRGARQMPLVDAATSSSSTSGSGPDPYAAPQAVTVVVPESWLPAPATQGSQ